MNEDKSFEITRKWFQIKKIYYPSYEKDKNFILYYFLYNSIIYKKQILKSNSAHRMYSMCVARVREHGSSYMLVMHRFRLWRSIHSPDVNVFRSTMARKETGTGVTSVWQSNKYSGLSVHDIFSLTIFDFSCDNF